jgi:hypothetical protein
MVLTLFPKFSNGPHCWLLGTTLLRVRPFKTSLKALATKFATDISVVVSSTICIYCLDMLHPHVQRLKMHLESTQGQVMERCSQAQHQAPRSNASLTSANNPNRDAGPLDAGQL